MLALTTPKIGRQGLRMWLHTLYKLFSPSPVASCNALVCCGCASVHKRQLDRLLVLITPKAGREIDKVSRDCLLFLSAEGG